MFLLPGSSLDFKSDNPNPIFFFKLNISIWTSDLFPLPRSRRKVGGEGACNSRGET